MSNKPQDVQVATFMASIRSEAVEIFNTFGCTEAQMGNLVEIKQLFQTYFTPKMNVTYERYNFNRMVQEEGESFDEFLTKAKTQSAKCEFNVLHDSLLADKIIIGIRSEAAREKLLAIEDATLDRVTQMCRAMELTSKQLRDLNGDSSTTVHVIANKYTQRQRPSSSSGKSTSSSRAPDTFDCKRCGRSHGPKECPAYGKKCKNCNREGHWAAVCRSASTSNSNQQKQSSKPKVHAVSEMNEDQEDDTDEEFYINCIEKDDE